MQRDRLRGFFVVSSLVFFGVALVSSAACSSNGGKKDNKNNPCAVDADSDGYDACKDCDDNDAARNPGAQEACGDGIDNNCDGSTDENCGSCNPNTGDTQACGVDGAGCVQACQDDFTWGPCLPADGSTPDYQTDVKNCGQCGNECPTPKNATAACVSGQCGRGPCAPGFYDLDGHSMDGCHWQCQGTTCTRDTGETVTLSAPPLPETGATVRALASGSSFGGQIQVSTSYTNFGILGEGSVATKDAPQQSSASYLHQGGLTAAEPK